MDAIGDALTSLPLPLGPIVTGLLPFGLIVGVAVAAWAYPKRRRALVIGGALLAGACGIGMIAFQGAINS